MITVIHTCTHTQQTGVDDMATRAVKMGIRTDEQAKLFVQQQVEWLQRQMCPECYCREKSVNPNLKPR